MQTRSEAAKDNTSLTPCQQSTGTWLRVEVEPLAEGGRELVYCGRLRPGVRQTSLGKLLQQLGHFGTGELVAGHGVLQNIHGLAREEQFQCTLLL